MSAVSQTMLRTPARLRKDRRSAISHSRRSGGPSPSAIASSLTIPIGRSAAITFQVASDAASSRFSQASCVAPRMQASPRVTLVPAGIAVAAHVDHEDVEQRTIGDLAIDTAILRRVLADRHEFVEGAAGARDQARGAVIGIAAFVRACRPATSRWSPRDRPIARTAAPRHGRRENSRRASCICSCRETVRGCGR